MITCPQCQHQNPEGALICEACGMLFIPSGPPGTTRHLALEEDSVAGTVPIRGTRTFPISAQLVIDMGEVSEQQILRVDDEVVIGRVDHHTDFLPDLNLTRFGAWERGVSRLHAAIRRSGDTLLLVDLGSTNGTYLNGDRLAAREVRELRDGDRIRLGLFEMEIYYQQPAQDEPDVSLQ